MNGEEASAVVVEVAFQVHCELGPGLLESVYEDVLTHLLRRRGLRVERQVPVSFEYQGLLFHGGLRPDLLIEGSLVVELKSVEHLAPVHAKILLTYLRLLKLPVGLLINFGSATFKEGIKRIVNGRVDRPASQLRVKKAAAIEESNPSHRAAPD